MYTDQRTHIAGPPRSVRLPRVSTTGGGSISKAPIADEKGSDGTGSGRRLVVAGRESLRILRASEPAGGDPLTSSGRPLPAADSSIRDGTNHKSATSRFGFRLDASRNLWDGSGLKVDSALTDVGWGCGLFSNKIVTSARNGELIMWDLHKSGGTKFERRAKDHIRSINVLSISTIVQYYCVTGSSDGDVRVWDLRDLTRSLMKIHHPTSVRSLVFSTSPSSPLQIGVGLDNGSIYRWDLQKGPIRHMDRLPIAHSGPVLALDWSNATSSATSRERDSVGVDDTSINHAGGGGSGGGIGTGNAGGWMVSGGLDRTVKIWDASLVHIPQKPMYTLHPSFPVRRVIWRPGYECEVALVSNEEFSTGSGDGLGTSPIDDAGGGGAFDTGGDKANGKGSGDAVEIWDVRRGWIAKWTVAGSAIEGGVTDVEFGDSHTLWAQHTSGTFSQLDLRASHKPLDAIPRTSVTWEAGGALAFVSGKKGRWEVPYDDVHLDKRPSTQERRTMPKLKGLGDSPALLTSQTFGTYARETTLRDAAVLAKLARRYIIEGADRATICAQNAEAAYDEGKDQAAQAWLLVGSLLSDIVPPPTPPPTPPRLPTHANPGLPHSVSAPAALPTVYPHVRPTPEPTVRTSSSEPITKNGALAGGQSSASPSRTASRLATPASSNPTSPHRAPVSLPPSTPASRRASGSPLDRRASSARTTSPRRMSSFNAPRPSISGLNSEGDSPKGHSSHRHVGEGALDDSDSSSSDDEHVGHRGSSDEESGLKPLISPYQSTRVVPTTPSPLSHIAGQQHWTEDEEEGEEGNETSPSPGSTDTESSGSVVNNNLDQKRTSTSVSRSRQSSRAQTRSRSSTVASLAASSLLHVRRPPLIKQESQSSIRTVHAGDSVPVHEEVDLVARGRNSPALSSEPRRRQRSQGASSEYMPNTPEVISEPKALSPERSRKMSEKRKTRIIEEEVKFREMGWVILREALHRFADEGDVQMCAMLSIVASEELQISKQKTARFVESYIDVLTHLRLHISAAYVRKYSDVGDVRSVTRLETTIYTSCARCRKAIVVPSASLNLKSRGPYAHCRSCQNTTNCSICNLPVRTLLFQCSVCNHGGHQECYRRYYMQRPMIDVVLPSAPSNEPRGRPVARNSSITRGEADSDSVIGDHDVTGVVAVSRTNNIAGHPCAAGCGHFCWAATGIPQPNDT